MVMGCVTPWGSEIRRVLNSLALRSMVVPWTGPFRIATYSSWKRLPYLTRGGEQARRQSILGVK
jgi:hypothetical protein